MPQLTEDIIAEAMDRAWRAVCSPANERCYGLPYGVKEAQETCTPEGRCKIGWVVADAGRKAWDAWLDTRTGEGRLRRQAHEPIKRRPDLG